MQSKTRLCKAKTADKFTIKLLGWPRMEGRKDWRTGGEQGVFRQEATADGNTPLTLIWMSSSSRERKWMCAILCGQNALRKSERERGREREQEGAKLFGGQSGLAYPPLEYQPRLCLSARQIRQMPERTYDCSPSPAHFSSRLITVACCQLSVCVCFQCCKAF